MKILILLGALLLAACTQVVDETIVEETFNETNETTPDPIPELPEEEVTSLTQCDGLDTPCLKSRETVDEYNYCEEDNDCTFAPIPSCTCSTPDSSGRAVNIDELEAYNSYKAEFCMKVDIPNCPQYSPPNKYSKYESRCVSNICRTVRVGWR